MFCSPCRELALREIEDGVGDEISSVVERNHMSASSASATTEQLLAMAAELKEMRGDGCKYASIDGRDKFAENASQGRLTGEDIF